MIKRITKPIVLKYENRFHNIPDNVKKEIGIFWKNLVSDNPSLFNGENHTVESVTEFDDHIEMKVVRTNYATYLYNERVGIDDDKFKIIHLWSGILFETNDNYLVLGEMGDNTSVPKWLQLTGGGTSDEDIVDDIIDIDGNLKREVKEELNIDLDTIKYEMKYLECPSEVRSVYGFLAVGKINMNKEELNQHFERYKDYLEKNGMEQEFSKLVFLHKNTALDEFDRLDNPKREYLRELLEMVINDN